MVRCLSEDANSGIFVSEELTSGQPIPVRRDTVAAFIGTAPRGPVGIPVTIDSVDEYLRRFGVPGCDTPLLNTVSQFFANGGKNAIVVRVCSSARRHCIGLAGPSGSLILEAVNPGPHELLRASVDYDGIASTEHNQFNLVIHRLASRDQPIVDQQEVYRSLSADMADPNFVGHALSTSGLVTVKGEIPEQRPDVTFCPGIEVGASYVYVDPEWRETDCLTDYDLIGCNTEGTGLFALDQIPAVDLVTLVPDAHNLGPVVLFAAERYCRKRNAILLVDPPTHWRSAGSAIRLARKSGFLSPNVVTYFPRPTNSDQLPASVLGSLAGALVSGDAQDGIWGLREDAPLVMRDRGRLPFDLAVEEQHALQRVGINALRRTGRSRLELTGFVTLNQGSGCAPEWDELRLRRTVLFVIDSIIRGTRWAAFQENDAGTRAELRDQVQRYLRDLHTAGALSGANDADSGYVICNALAPEGHNRGGIETGSNSGISFVVGFTPCGHEMMSFRFSQHPVECQVQALHIEHPVALAS